MLRSAALVCCVRAAAGVRTGDVRGDGDICAATDAYVGETGDLRGDCEYMMAESVMIDDDDVCARVCDCSALTDESTAIFRCSATGVL